MGILCLDIQLFPDGLHFPLSFEWKKEASMQQGVRFGDTIIIGSQVYCRSANTVHQYDPASGTWTVLPKVPVELFSIASLNEQLVVVGGLDEGSRSTAKAKTIYAWDSQNEKWTTPFGNPSLRLGVSRPGCGNYKHYLIVAGGFSSRMFTPTVDILDTREGKWYSASPLPETGDIFGTVIIGEMLYLLLHQEGKIVVPSRLILGTSMLALIKQAKSGANDGSSVWKQLPDVLHYVSTIFSIGNMLLTIGEWPVGTTITPLEPITMKLPTTQVNADIHIFNPYTRLWLKVGELPEMMVRCACTMLPSGRLLVAGGSTGVKGGQSLVSSVYTAKIRH